MKKSYNSTTKSNSHVTIHIYMEISQGNSLYSYLKQKTMSFVFSKSEYRRAEQVLSGGVGNSGRERMWGKGIGG
jgi:hypothetical protein